MSTINPTTFLPPRINPASLIKVNTQIWTHIKTGSPTFPTEWISFLLSTSTIHTKGRTTRIISKHLNPLCEVRGSKESVSKRDFSVYFNSNVNIGSLLSKVGLNKDPNETIEGLSTASGLWRNLAGLL